MTEATQNTLDLLHRYESRNVTFRAPEGDWPIVWERARGVHVWDADGRRYLDLTAAFGVANTGHANPRIVRAGQAQMAKLLHAMGDVHPHALKAELARELSRWTFERWTKSPRHTAKTIFCNSGFEAVEAALKTALLGTGRRGVVAFEGAYHGLGYGTLNATHRPMFREPFQRQLGSFGEWVRFPATATELRLAKSSLPRLLRSGRFGAVLFEPVQGRAGMRVPHPGFPSWLRRECERHGVLLIADEIFTGFGRTGKWFACEHSQVVPDLVCLGKALTGGFPLSACVGRADLMDAAWPASEGEAIHTSTFLGHPVGCAMALASLRELRARQLSTVAGRRGRHLLRRLGSLKPPRGIRLLPRGLGLMAGLEIQTADGRPATALCVQIVKRLLQHGFILLPDGDDNNVIAFTPPLTITDAQLTAAARALQTELDRGEPGRP